MSHPKHGSFLRADIVTGEPVLASVLATDAVVVVTLLAKSNPATWNLVTPLDGSLVVYGR